MPFRCHVQQLRSHCLAGSQSVPADEAVLHGRCRPEPTPYKNLRSAGPRWIARGDHPPTDYMSVGGRFRILRDVDDNSGCTTSRAAVGRHHDLLESRRPQLTCSVGGAMLTGFPYNIVYTTDGSLLACLSYRSCKTETWVCVPRHPFADLFLKTTRHSPKPAGCSLKRHLMLER